VQSSGLIDFHLSSGGRESSDNSRCATDGISLWFGLWLFLLGYGSYLVKVTSEDGGVWDVLGGFRKLKEDDPSADNEEAHDNGNDGSHGSFKPPEKNRRRNNRGAREIYVICRCNQCSIEYI
jgi:hypothetical protein